VSMQEQQKRKDTDDSGEKGKSIAHHPFTLPAWREII